MYNFERRKVFEHFVWCIVLFDTIFIFNYLCKEKRVIRIIFILCLNCIRFFFSNFKILRFKGFFNEEKNRLVINWELIKSVKVIVFNIRVRFLISFLIFKWR